MPKYWGKQIFAHGRFPEVGQKQKTQKKGMMLITMAKLRMAHAWRAQAAWATRSPWSFFPFAFDPLRGNSRA